MIITEHPLIARWLAYFTESTKGALTTREGVFHSPHGTVEILSQRYRMQAATQMDTQSTRLRMVYNSIGWEYADDGFYEQARLSRLAAAFAALVANICDDRQRTAAARDVAQESTMSSPLPAYEHVDTEKVQNCENRDILELIS